MRFKSFKLTAVCAIVTVAALTACAPTSNPSQSPSNSLTQSQTPTPTVAPVDFIYYYVADTPQGLRLFPEVHQIAQSNNQLFDALNDFVKGQEPAHDPDYENLWGSGSSINSVKVEGTLATIDLALGTLNLGAEAESVAIASLVWAVTTNSESVNRVQFTINGVIVESLAGHVDLTLPLKKQPASDILNPVTISVPVDGSNLMGEVEIRGMACTFEANVAWELMSENVIIDAGSTMSSESCPMNSPWSLNLGVLPTGAYVFRAFELSAKDGSLVAEETRTFSVTN